MSSKKKRKKRQRQRSDGSGAVAAPSRKQESRGPAAQPRAAARPADERPPAPWGSFPLVETLVLCGILLLIAGVAFGGSRSAALIVSGLVLASLGGLELSVREHFAGFRSHTTLLAGVPAAIVLGVLYYLAPSTMSPLARVAVAAAVFVAFAWLLASAFRKRAGVAFKLR